jgi:hypothetical protein
MTVVAFTPARFSPDDLWDFDQIAWPRLTSGLWSHVSRVTCHDSDQILVFFHRLPRPIFRFERDRSGTYTLWFHGASGPHIIATGASATECLSIWNGNGEA